MSTVPASGRGRVVFLGTSLTAGYGLDPSQAYPALIQQKIDSAGLPFEAVNAGVSGETSAGALRRIDWLLQQPMTVLVVETGANDGLRGQNVDSLEANIQAIIDRANALKPRPRIVLVGMRMLTNYGPGYIGRFARIYPELAKRNDLPLVPFLLDGVAGVDSLNQADADTPDRGRTATSCPDGLAHPRARAAAGSEERSGSRLGQDLGERRDGDVDLFRGVVVVG